MLLSGKSLLVLADGTIKLIASLDEVQELRKGAKAILYTLNIVKSFGYNKAENYPKDIPNVEEYKANTPEEPLKAISVEEDYIEVEEKVSTPKKRGRPKLK